MPGRRLIEEPSLYDWARDAMSQLTIDAANDSNPVWSHDGRHIVFASDRGGSSLVNLNIANSDGTGTVTRLTDSANPQQAWSFHPSGTFIAFQEVFAATGNDLMILPLAHDPSRGWIAGTPPPFLQNPGTECSRCSRPMATGSRTSPMRPAARWMCACDRFPAQAGPYDIHPDGKRLALIAAKAQATVVLDQIVVVSNFFDYLWQIAPGRK